MDNEKHFGILTILLPQIIREIINNESIDEDQAVESFYRSRVYAVLENEQTKLWHLSAKAIYELYNQEKQNGVIDFPEEA